MNKEDRKVGEKLLDDVLGNERGLVVLQRVVDRLDGIDELTTQAIELVKNKKEIDLAPLIVKFELLHMDISNILSKDTSEYPKIKKDIDTLTYRLQDIVNAVNSNGLLSTGATAALIEEFKLMSDKMSESIRNIIPPETFNKLPDNAATESTLKSVAGFNIPPYDDIVITYVPSGNGAGQIATVTYKLLTVTQSVLTLSYNSDNKLIDVIKS